MTTEKIDIHNQLMKKAYKKYTDDISYNEFVVTLDYVEKVAVLTGNFNYQVCNGGFLQWYDNGYSSEADQLLIILEKYKKGKPAITEAINLIKECLAFIKKFEQHEQEMKNQRRGWDEDDEEEDEYNLYDDLNPLDSKYYKINDQFLVEVEEVLRGL